MNITIRSKEVEIYKYYLIIINSLRPVKLFQVEIDVLSRLMYIDNKYQQYDKLKRDLIIFSTEAKKQIRESLENMTEKHFNATMYNLRKKGLISKDSLLINTPKLVNDSLNITFNIQKYEPDGSD